VVVQSVERAYTSASVAEVQNVEEKAKQREPMSAARVSK